MVRVTGAGYRRTEVERVDATSLLMPPVGMRGRSFVSWERPFFGLPPNPYGYRPVESATIGLLGGDAYPVGTWQSDAAVLWLPRRYNSRGKTLMTRAGTLPLPIFYPKSLPFLSDRLAGSLDSSRNANRPGRSRGLR